MNPNQNEFCPDYAVHPGETLEEEIRKSNMSQSELAKRTGIIPKTINSIIKGNASISADTASRLGMVLDRNAHYWLKLENDYQLAKIEIENKKHINNELSFLDAIDYNELSKKKWVKKTTDSIEQLKQIYSFFKVANVSQIHSVWNQLEVSYRTSTAFQKSQFHIMAWLRKGEIDAEKIECKPYNLKTFKEALAQCRKLTTKKFEDIYKDIQNICADAGVAVVYIPELPNVSTSGAAQWLSKDKALIQLSLRGKRDDKFWFNFYHEAGHILLHGRKEQFIDSESNYLNPYNTEENRLKEFEADDFASDMLIPRKKFGEFVSFPIFNEDTIQRFARELGISPGIVVGQLQHRKHIGWSKFNKLKTKYDFPKELK